MKTTKLLFYLNCRNLIVQFAVFVESTGNAACVNVSRSWSRTENMLVFAQMANLIVINILLICLRLFFGTWDINFKLL